MKSMSKMNVNELRAYAVELGADEKRLYGTSKDSLKIIISNLKNEKKKEENTQENTEEIITEENTEEIITEMENTQENTEMENKKDMLNSMTVKELRAEAKAQGIKGMSKAKKDELIAALMSHNYNQPDPEEHTVEISKVRMYTFTGMYIGEFEAEVHDDKILVYTKRRGELMFDLNTGKEITDKNKARYANKIEAA